MWLVEIVTAAFKLSFISHNIKFESVHDFIGMGGIGLA